MGYAIVRADASPSIGGGHIVRSMALAEALRARGWQCALACRSGTRDVVPWATADIRDVLEMDELAPAEAAALRGHWPDGCDLLIVDHYERDERFERECRSWAGRILAIDDLADRPHDCDVLVDSTHGRTADAYRKRIPAGAESLLGTDYCLLRPQFAQLRFRRGRLGGGHPLRVFVGLGATDPKNVTSICLGALAKTGIPLTVDVVLGAAAPHLVAVRALLSRLPFTATLHLDDPDVARLMAGADLAIGAGGGSAWERCCLGLPNIVISIAANQDLIAGALAEQGAAEIVPFTNGAIDRIAAVSVRLLQDVDARRDMALKSARLCDGLGAARVADAVEPIRAGDGGAVRLRRATTADADLLLTWQQAPEMRRYFRNPTVPTAQGHRQWLAAKLADVNCLLHIVQHRGVAAGMVRLDRVEVTPAGHDASFEVSILVAPDRQRLGLAAAALALLRRMLPWASLVAEVHPDNAASGALFRRAGFVPVTAGKLVATPLAESRG